MVNGDRFGAILVSQLGTHQYFEYCAMNIFLCIKGKNFFCFIRKSVVMLISVGIMLSLKYAMRVYRRRSKSVTTI